MSLLKNSTNLISAKNSVVSLDTCTLSNLARYRDIVINGEKSDYYGKYDEKFINEYENLYKTLKEDAKQIIIPLVGQIEIASSYSNFLPMMRVVGELDCELKPFPSLTLMHQMLRFVSPKKLSKANVSLTQTLILSKYYNEEKHAELVRQSTFMKPMLNKYRREYRNIKVDEVCYYQNVASVLSLIYRNKNENRNRMIAVKDMFDSIILAESQMYGADYFITNNIKDFKKSINFSASDLVASPYKYFKDDLLRDLYEEYDITKEPIDSKHMLDFFKKHLKEEYDDFDLLLLSNIAHTMSASESDEKYQKFLLALSKTIHTQRYELKVSIMKRDENFFDFVNSISYTNCEEKIMKLWNDTVQAKIGKNSDLVEAIYNAQGIHEKHDDADKEARRRERIIQLFGVSSERELIDSLVYSMLRYKGDISKNKNNIEIKFVGIK